MDTPEPNKCVIVQWIRCTFLIAHTSDLRPTGSPILQPTSPELTQVQSAVEDTQLNLAKLIP
jgi:hypothetical protein